MASRIAASRLVDFARALLLAAGMPADKADAVAGVLVEGDLMGHTTHGLQLLASYLGEIEKRSMAVEGDPQVLSDKPAALLWMADGCPARGSCCAPSSTPRSERSRPARARW